MKKCFIAAIVALAVPFSAYALPPRPASCPSAASVAQVGYDVVKLVTDSQRGTTYWHLFKENATYGTPEHWTAFIGLDGRLTDQQAAIARAQAIATQVTLEGPFEDKQDDAWACMAFDRDDGDALGRYYVVTITPTQPNRLPESVASMVRM